MLPLHFGYRIIENKVNKDLKKGGTKYEQKQQNSIQKQHRHVLYAHADQQTYGSLYGRGINFPYALLFPCSVVATGQLYALHKISGAAIRQEYGDEI